jgi:ABC-type antimicrobial peptide transport system permease subunit
LKYFGKQQLAVLFATIISAAVLTGALIVGDSVRMSLQKNVDQRLGEVALVLAAGDRLISQETAVKTGEELQIKTAAILHTQGMAINATEDLRHNRIQVYGVDERFWAFSNTNFPIKYGEAVLSKSLADELKVKVDERLLIRIQKPSVIPLNAPFTNDEETSVSLRLKVVAIADQEQLGGFSIRNEQKTAYNVFVNEEQLADKLDLKGLCNLIVAEKTDKIKLDSTFAANWNLNDASLQIQKSEEASHWVLSSNRVFLEDAVIQACQKVDTANKKVLTYFVNELNIRNQQTPYSFVSGVEDTNLSEDHIILNSWLAQDLKAKPGDSILLKYFVMGPLRQLQEKSHSFLVQDIYSINHPSFSQDLMPDFPGLSTAGNCSDWDAGIPIDLTKIRDKDEVYWDEYRGTPKAIISLHQAKELWQNPYGSYTSVWFSSDIEKEQLSKKIVSALKPIDFGFQFLNVKQKGQQAAQNGVDFGELFLSLSFFVIASAILLLVLIYQLQLEGRMKAVGVLLALGFPKNKIIRMRLMESFPVIVLGAAIGSFMGIIYNLLLIKGLNSIWNQAVHTSILEAFVLPKTIFIGFLISIILAFISIWLILRKQLKKQVIAIVRDDKSVKIKPKSARRWPGMLLLIASMGLTIYSIVSSIEKNSSLMLTAGFLLMTSGIFLLNYFWKYAENKPTALRSTTQLSQFNLKRNKLRSLAVVILLALGTFTIIVTGANRKTFNDSESIRSSGTGGFLFWGESSIPVLNNLNSEEGREKQGLEAQTVLDSCLFVQFQSKAGDDASCLNLNQVQQPQVLGVDAHLLDSLEAFSFATQLQEQPHPWLQLNESTDELIIPAIADQTVIQWGLIKKLGDTLHYFNEEGKPLKLVLVAGLNASIFQGNILISEEYFNRHFPAAVGSKMMLIDGQAHKKGKIKHILTNDLADYGMELTETSTRLAQFYSVTNTYLSIFMILGGLGVIIGTIGLGMILLRNMLDRRQELKLLFAVGFTSGKIFQIIFTENMILVLWGMSIGLVSAFVGILPSLLSEAFHIPGYFLIWIVLSVFASAVFWIFISSKMIIRRLGI